MYKYNLFTISLEEDNFSPLNPVRWRLQVANITYRKVTAILKIKSLTGHLKGASVFVKVTDRTLERHIALGKSHTQDKAVTKPTGQYW